MGLGRVLACCMWLLAGWGVKLSLLCDLDESGGCGAYCLGFTREKDEREGMREAKFRAEMTVEFVRAWRTR